MAWLTTVTTLQSMCHASPRFGLSGLAPTATPTDGASAPHDKNGAAVVNPGGGIRKGGESSTTRGQKCMTFTSERSDWYYSNAAPWQGSGVFTTSPTEICVDRSDDAGGAMFIAPVSNTLPGSTKLECYFPTSGTANCDISLVDGYSLSVTCVTGAKSGPIIGGDLNLWRTGATCDDQSLIEQGICKNDQGYAALQDDVSSFFKDATQNGNNYCIWVDCGQDYFFDVEESIQCHVSGGQMEEER